jgi:hypothetical protein
MNKMTLNILLFLFPALLAHGQDKEKNIYEIGKPLTSCECNFENLFANWGPRFITNHDKFQLLSHEFVETLSDTGRIAFYTREIFGPGALSVRHESKMQGHYNQDVTEEIREARITPSHIIDIPQGLEKEAQLEFQKMSELMLRRLRVGDKVYAVKFNYEGTEQVAYAFCRPGENKVIFDNWAFYHLEELQSTTGRADEARIGVN